MKDQTLVVASNIIFVKGYKKNLIIDLQHDCWYHVDFLLETDEQILNIKTEDLTYMVEEGIVFEIPTEIKSNFIPINREYFSPNIIENAIIDRDDSSVYSILKAIKLLNSIQNKHLQIRWFSSFKIEEFESVLKATKTSSCESIDVILPFDENFKVIVNLKSNYPKLSKIIFHSTPENKQITNHDSPEIFFTTEEILSSNNCGQISPYFFSRNRGHVLKSMNFNSCLHKKLGIDISGNIKNCPSMADSNGNVSDFIDLLNINFNTKIGNIKKDSIKVCQDCEFRYICTDCRVFIDDPSDDYSRPSKCEYNPYISKWKNEENYISIEDYNLNSN